MKQLLTLAIVLASIFASTFFVLNVTGVITIEKIQHGLQGVVSMHRFLACMLVVFLLGLDIVIAVPTLTVVILAGHFLGFGLGAASAIAGLFLAGFTGYGVSRKCGTRLLRQFYKDPEKLRDMQRLFNQHGPVALLLCRALPILPEVTCCLAGINRMPLRRFFLYYSIASIPYACAAAYAGSRSSIDDPTPALFTAMAISFSLWLAWSIFLKRSLAIRA